MSESDDTKKGQYGYDPTARQGHIADLAKQARLERSPRHMLLVDKAIKSAKFRLKHGYWPDSAQVREWEP